MLHVGNDIVDLTHPNAKGKSRDIRFLKRVFLPEEEDCLLADIQPDAMLWALWTGKEAAYKVRQKDYPDISSAPRRYRVDLARRDTSGRECILRPGTRAFAGTVATPRGIISLHTLIAPDYVHSVALSVPSSATADRVVMHAERMHLAEQSSPSYESSYVREIAIRQLARTVNSSIHDIAIRRNQEPRGLGAPYVYVQGRLASIDISLSHDGAFAAFAFTLRSWLHSENDKSLTETLYLN